MVRERSAKPLFTGSNPVAASSRKDRGVSCRGVTPFFVSVAICTIPAKTAPVPRPFSPNLIVAYFLTVSVKRPYVSSQFPQSNHPFAAVAAHLNA